MIEGVTKPFLQSEHEFRQKRAYGLFFLSICLLEIVKTVKKSGKMIIINASCLLEIVKTVKKGGKMIIINATLAYIS